MRSVIACARPKRRKHSGRSPSGAPRTSRRSRAERRRHAMLEPFTTPIEPGDSDLIGPLRAPRQMLAAQKYDDHTSIHDNETAQRFGFKGGTIEGPTHFSQFAPLCVALWGPKWLAQGSVSAHYPNPCSERGTA